MPLKSIAKYVSISTNSVELTFQHSMIMTVTFSLQFFSKVEFVKSKGIGFVL